MIRGSCLCGAVRFEIDRAMGPFEYCHCSRCRKTSGSAFMAALGVMKQDYRLVRGAEMILRYEAPILESPPAYRVAFCGQCGSPVPDPPDDAEWFEVPAGLLDDDPGLRPDKHIYVDHKAAWHEISDALPQLTKRGIAEHRRNRPPADSR